MGTRVASETFDAIASVLPHAQYFSEARIVIVGAMLQPEQDDLLVLVA